MAALAESMEIAPKVTGVECFATEPCSHNTQFGKGVPQGIPTPELALRSPSRCLCVCVLNFPHIISSVLNRQSQAYHLLRSKRWVYSCQSTQPNERWNLQRLLRLLITGQMKRDQLASDCCTGRPVNNYTTLVAKLVGFFSGRARKYRVRTM